MTRDQAQPGTRVGWDIGNGRHQTGTILAAPADQSEHVLVTWQVGSQRINRELALRGLRRIPEVGR